MRSVSIIGAGQLGSRHLQGLLKSTQDLSIFVLDSSADSLNLSRQRAKEVNHQHTIFFTSSWSDLPVTLDLVIVSTSSNVRNEVVAKLLNNYEVQHLILEKVLFQDVDSYKTISDLISERSVATWVNHPRRMFSQYKEIKKILLPDDTNKIYSVVGGNWGLGCNGLHFIDLFAFLDDSIVEDVDSDWLDNSLLESKRFGFVEFSGTMRGSLSSGSKFIISSFKGNPTPVTVMIGSTMNRWLIQEGGSTPQIHHFSLASDFSNEVINFETNFQSDLTSKVASDLFTTGNCELPSFVEAVQSHTPFITELLSKYNKITKGNSLICPIT